MAGKYNPKIVGASVIGFALVAGAYVVSNFNKASIQLPQNSAVSTVEIATREPIIVTDNNQNGIEDWRDEFVTSEPIHLDQATSTYRPPDTITGKMAVGFMEDLIRSRGYGQFGSTDEEIINRTVGKLTVESDNKLYDTPDVIVLSEWTDRDIVNYANIAADIIKRNNVPDLDSELIILKDILDSRDESRIEELNTLAEVYRRYRDETLNLPVPAFLVKEHLDLINTYHAIYKDIEGMTLVLDDPAVTMLRLKRYEDDATGLGLALQNVYLALEPHAHLFTVEDPAVLFVTFSPDFKI